MARELAPARRRSLRKTGNRRRVADRLGPLRSPAGASSLATGIAVVVSDQLVRLNQANPGRLHPLHGRRQ